MSSQPSPDIYDIIIPQGTSPYRPGTKLTLSRLTTTTTPLTNKEPSPTISLEILTSDRNTFTQNVRATRLAGTLLSTTGMTISSPSHVRVKFYDHVLGLPLTLASRTDGNLYNAGLSSYAMCNEMKREEICYLEMCRERGLKTPVFYGEYLFMRDLVGVPGEEEEYGVPALVFEDEEIGDEKKESNKKESDQMEMLGVDPQIPKVSEQKSTKPDTDPSHEDPWYWIETAFARAARGCEPVLRTMRT